MIGIVILNYKTCDETIQCILKIKEHPCSINLHFYVVDNDSQDKSYEKLSSVFQDDNSINVIQTGQNKGYSYGNNVGIKKAISDGADSILICNSDVEISNDVIEILHQELMKNDEIGMISPKIINRDKEEDLQLRPKINYNIYMEESRLFKPSPKYYTKTSDISGPIYIHDGKICGCCFLAKAKALSKIDYLDERFFLYYEEDVLAYRMTSANLKMAFLKNVSAIHWGQTSTKKTGQAFSKYHAYTSIIKVLKYYAKENTFKLTWLSYILLLKYFVFGLKEKECLEKINSLKEDLYNIIHKNQM